MHKSYKSAIKFQKWKFEANTRKEAADLKTSEWMKIKSLHDNIDFYNCGHHLEVSHCGQLLTVQSKKSLFNVNYASAAD